MLRPKVFPEKLPLGTEELLRVLDTAFPHRCIEPGEDLSEALAYSGARALIDTLLEKFEEDKTEEQPPEDKWFSGDAVLENYIEGNW